MVDLHTHILPGIDDGATSIEEALAMADALTKQNIDTIVGTPHFDLQKTSLTEFLLQRDSAIEALRLQGLTVVSGSETTFHEALIAWSDLSSLCIADTKYLLLELPFDNKWDKNLLEQLDNLIRRHSLNLLIAHIERYPAVKRRWIKRFHGIGCLLQMNADSIINKKSRRRCLRFLKKGYIDVVASDCHNINVRAPKLNVACQLIECRLNPEVLGKLILNAERIVKGERLSLTTDYYILPQEHI